MNSNQKKLLYIFLTVLAFFIVLSNIIFPMLNSGMSILELSGAILGVGTIILLFTTLSKIKNKTFKEENNEKQKD